MPTMSPRRLIGFGLLIVLALVAISGTYLYTLRSHRSADLLDRVYERFDSEFPGRGTTDYPGNEVGDIPKSYAMILLAELERKQTALAQHLPNLGPKAGRWLLDNARLSPNGIVGWGVPVAWDAYGDGSVNPENTIYSISTAIVANALMTWMEADEEAPKDEILATLSSAFDAFIKAPRTPSGLLPYSLEQADARYDTFNSAAYMAGEMQRFVKYVDDPSLSNRIKSAADATVVSLIEHHQDSPSGSWYWRYSLQENAANDLPHAGYIIEGLRVYIKEGGRLAAQIDWAAVVTHLADFADDTGKITAWPPFASTSKLPPRLYDLGIALHLACTEPLAAPLAARLLASVSSYEAEDGGFLKYPIGAEGMEPLVVNEYEAYLWRGLVSCSTSANEKRSTAPDLVYRNELGLTPFRRELVEDALAQPATSGAVTVPFVVLKTEGISASVKWDSQKQQSSIELDDLRSLSFDRSGVPSALAQIGEDRFVVAFREIPTGRLWLVDWDTQGGTLHYAEVSRPGVDFVIFRGMFYENGTITLVIYDNRTAANYIRTYRGSENGWKADGADLELPTLEDPAGTHYEMEPPLFLFGDQDGALNILGGTLNASLRDGKITEDRVPDCVRILEAVQTDEGPAVLCNAKSGGFVLLHPGQPPRKFQFRDGVPYQLAWDRFSKSVTWRLAIDANSYAEMFRFDIERGQSSGFLEFGVNNVEGRIPWSQMYYLNGLMDSTLLARRDDEAYSVFFPLLREIRLRIELEVRLLDRMLADPDALATRAFSADRSLATFAVQSSRILLLLDRYRTEFPQASPLENFDRLVRQVQQLDGHIEVLASAGEDRTWIAPGTAHLRWPKGSAFYFDGMPVPYNHQNEWAAALFEVHRHSGGLADDPALGPQRQIIDFFLHRLAANDEFPSPDRWYYWWGHAYEGYGASSNRSVHTPAYVGDKSVSWISFRTIDLTSVLAALDYLSESGRAELRASAVENLFEGTVYPFAARATLDFSPRLIFGGDRIFEYARAASPWEFANVPWALAALPQRQEPEDPNSTRLNEIVLDRMPSLPQVSFRDSRLRDYLARYLEIALPYNTDQALKYAGKELGGKYVAWNLAYDLRATLLAAWQSADVQFLPMFERAADRILKMRDDRLGIVDDIRARPAKSWGSNRYSDEKKKWVAWDAFGGMMAYPLAEYCNVAEHLSYGDGERKCERYIQAAKEVLSEYDTYWVPSGDQGYYFDPTLYDIAPLNHMNTLGLAMLSLYEATQDRSYLDKVVRLANFFKSQWKVDSENTVTWEYWPQANMEENRSNYSEDVTHAQINMLFAYECYRHGIVFKYEDMKLLADSFSRHVVRSNADWALDLAGNGNAVETKLHEGLAGWIVLSEFLPELKERLESFVFGHPAGFPLGNASYATGPVSMAYSLSRAAN